LMASLGSEWREHFVLRVDPIMVPVDSVIPLGLLAIELVTNIGKYAYDGRPGPVEITLSSDGPRQLRFTVADKGSGMRAASTGFGTRMMRALVEELAGELTFDGNAPGLRATLILPTSQRK
jgi:two-component system, chemotaxis family, sensor kinase Cph1